MIDNTKCLNGKYSTTKLLTKLLTKDKPKIVENPEDKFESVLFLHQVESRKGEGGLRTKGYFKKSFENKPLISIITVVYNGEKYLEETIQSVINQTYDNVEYIIIDGGSTDGTVDIIKKYEDMIDYWVSEKDAGIYDAMNKGIDLVSGEWINFMNAGDKFYKISTVSKIFNNNIYDNDISIIYGDLEIDYGKFKRVELAKSTKCFYKGMPFSHQSSFINGQFHKENKYSLKYNIAGDFDFFFKAYKNKMIFKYNKGIVSRMDVEGLSDGNRFKSIMQRHIIVNKFDHKLENDLYYIYLYIDQFLRKLIKFVLPSIIINLIKKNK